MRAISKTKVGSSVLSMDSGNDQNSASTGDGRNGLASALARSPNLGAGSAVIEAGNAGLKGSAPKPAINSRRLRGKIALAMGPMRTIFEVECPVTAPAT